MTLFYKTNNMRNIKPSLKWWLIPWGSSFSTMYECWDWHPRHHSEQCQNGILENINPLQFLSLSNSLQTILFKIPNHTEILGYNGSSLHAIQGRGILGNWYSWLSYYSVYKEMLSTILWKILQKVFISKFLPF